MDALEVCANLPEEAISAARIVGKWVWVEFTEKPDPTTLTALKTLGFRWNPKRKCWQHSCGMKRRFNRHQNPREKYRDVMLADVLDGKADL